ncbi:MAG: tRNA uridine-5-carboxymethylaminomethyl(34) synthesis GTPase MnmE [Flavobacteriales bacterium]|nr:tRNA uridine-5-carboxymethylaminomethyl(34) synthesis GTPase MnmE [Flavobacteriales bacterium]
MAPATAAGAGAIAVIRISGKHTFSVVEKVFSPVGRTKMADAKGHTILFGRIMDGNEIVDEVLVSVFRSPRSFTGEDCVEVSCHGSTFIQKRILQLLGSHGCRMARPGEFAMRAFLNGKMDLSQAEAIGDLIASTSAAAHKVAMHQMRGGFGRDLSALREELMNFAALMELELDFAEEDVEFVDRTQMKALVSRILTAIEQLIGSFELGNVIKEGVQVAIIGEPNAGKSTLLNALLNEERAIVSEIPGTTRDTVEDELVIEGVRYRFADTAGIRQTADTIERLGIERTYKKTEQADIVLFLFDASTYTPQQVKMELNALRQRMPDLDNRLIAVANKTDRTDVAALAEFTPFNAVIISAKEKTGIDAIKIRLREQLDLSALQEDQTIVTNTRHIQALKGAQNALQEVMVGLEDLIPGDLVAIDIRRALYHLGEITGAVSPDDLLGHIFSKFCIGK